MRLPGARTHGARLRPPSCGRRLCSNTPHPIACLFGRNQEQSPPVPANPIRAPASERRPVQAKLWPPLGARQCRTCALRGRPRVSTGPGVLVRSSCEWRVRRRAACFLVWPCVACVQLRAAAPGSSLHAAGREPARSREQQPTCSSSSRKREPQHHARQGSSAAVEQSAAITSAVVSRARTLQEALCASQAESGGGSPRGFHQPRYLRMYR